MTLYHPLMVYIDMNDRRAKKMGSYDNVETLDQCKTQMRIWEDIGSWFPIVEFAQIYQNGELVGIHEFTSTGNPMEQFRMAHDI